ncbi:MAG: MgtC/SapB family protein [Dehalococcoidia bacterium]
MALDLINFDSDGMRLAVALGIGLLLGLERERRKGTGPSRGPAGIRTFALVALLGGVAMLLGGTPLLAVGLAFVATAVVVAYAFGDRSDPGLTTEVAVPVAFLLGALAMREPELAAGVGVTVTVLLASREVLQRFVSQALTEQEVHDGLLLGAAALVILPIVPDEAIGPYEAFNPFTIWRLVVLVMTISAAGYIALRLMGPRLGLPLSGLASGFVSSAATVGAMGSRAKREPGIQRPAVAGAVFSTLATVAQMFVVVGATNSDAFREIVPAMTCAGVAAFAYGLVFGIRALKSNHDGDMATGRAFEPKSAIIFAATVGAILFVSAILNEWLGTAGVTLSTAAAGFADTHSAAISVASLVASGNLKASDAAVPILLGFTTNSLTKAFLAWSSGGRSFALMIWPGLVLVLVAAWAGWGAAKAL